MKRFYHLLNFTGLSMICWALLFSHAATAEIAIIVNSGNPESTISASHAKKLFLGKKTSFASGQAAVAVDQAEGNETRNMFYQQLANKSEAQMKAYWSRMIFSGKATPPNTVADDADVKDWLTGHNNGIGYIDSSAVDASVKVLLILE